MNRCKYDTKLFRLKDEMKYDTRKIGYCLPLHPPKNNQYTIQELINDKKKNYTELQFMHEANYVNFPSIVNRCYLKTKKCGIRIVILHIINKT
jgi:hypothetical protein